MEYLCLETPVGKLYLMAEEDALVGIDFMLTEDGEEKETEVLLEAKKQLTAYFEGKRKCFSLPLRLRGTPFQLRVWKALLTIPYGETRSYADIAHLIGQPKAVRAVGGANNRNPLMIVVPCHRVIGKTGQLVGYAGGLAVKAHLLDLERGGLFAGLSDING